MVRLIYKLYLVIFKKTTTLFTGHCFSYYTPPPQFPPLPLPPPNLLPLPIPLAPSQLPTLPPTTTAPATTTTTTPLTIPTIATVPPLTIPPIVTAPPTAAPTVAPPATAPPLPPFLMPPSTGLTYPRTIYPYLAAVYTFIYNNQPATIVPVTLLNYLAAIAGGLASLA
jgi:hypothetical protein